MEQQENKQKKTLHIIPHSHWDREWYQSFEAHRMKLVELFDALIEVMETDPDYTTYHFDGQFVPVEDYLEIRPEMRERLLALIRADKIQIGPWYVLQDEFLTDGEANVRNMLYGIKLAKSVGADPLMVGYFPDSFGNISQAPQIVRGFGIDNAVFGRGLNDIGADNKVIKQNGITKSELIWRSPDGSEVIGILFANWYCNANELPSDPAALKDRILGIAHSAERFATTDQLLGMNGCDHQPLQKNLSSVIKTANEVQDEVVVRQSNFRDYIEEIRKHKDDLKPFTGEIVGQYTSGYGLLINTASTHIDIKQKNHETEHQLERIAEPLSALATLSGREYPSDYFLYAWRKLMQNHPHDSICTCSCDEVYEEMLTRFAKSYAVAEKLTEGACDYFAKAVDTLSAKGQKGEKAIVVFSLEPSSCRRVVKTHVDFDRDDSLTDVTVYAPDGSVVPAKTRLIRNQFTYTLPSDRFRQPRYVDRFEIEFPVETSGIGYTVYSVARGKTGVDSAIRVWEHGMESGELSLTFADNGSFTLTDKTTGQVYGNQNLLIDEQDLGESYNFRKGDRPTLTADSAQITLYEQTPYSATFAVKIHLSDEEDVTSYVTLTEGIHRVDIATKIVNRGENHRIRATFQSDVVADHVLSEGQFDLVSRPIQPEFTWQNPSNDQRDDSFILLEGENRGLCIANRGLHEYEVYRDGKNTAAITLLRCVGEMGDWGVFPTPKAQCKGEYLLEYSVIPYGADRPSAVNAAYAFAAPSVIAVGADLHEGRLPAGQDFIALDNPMIRMSALKKAEDRDSLIFRIYNLSDSEEDLHVTLGGSFTGAYLTNLNEERISPLTLTDGRLSLTVGKKKIVTLELEKAE
ncbi:MAG: alpha-mannosidase [Eubacteriales bacterium]